MENRNYHFYGVFFNVGMKLYLLHNIPRPTIYGMYSTIFHFPSTIFVFSYTVASTFFTLFFASSIYENLFGTMIELADRGKGNRFFK